MAITLSPVSSYKIKIQKVLLVMVVIFLLRMLSIFGASWLSKEIVSFQVLRSMFLFLTLLYFIIIVPVITYVFIDQKISSKVSLAYSLSWLGLIAIFQMIIDIVIFVVCIENSAIMFVQHVVWNGIIHAVVLFSLCTCVVIIKFLRNSL